MLNKPLLSTFFLFTLFTGVTFAEAPIVPDRAPAVPPMMSTMMGAQKAADEGKRFGLIINNNKQHSITIEYLVFPSDNTKTTQTIEPESEFRIPLKDIDIDPKKTQNVFISSASIKGTDIKTSYPSSNPSYACATFVERSKGFYSESPIVLDLATVKSTHIRCAHPGFDSYMRD